MRRNLNSQPCVFSLRVLSSFALVSAGIFLAALGFAGTPPSEMTGLRVSTASSSSPGCGSAWGIVPTVNFGSGNNELYGIAVVFANDMWAVGRYSDASGYKTLTLHWDGSTWTILPSPNVGSSFNQLFSVTGASSNDVWAVGASSNDNVLFQTLIEHWDGAQWSTIASPLAPGTSSFLYGIAAVAGNDIWAVGYIQVGFSAQQPLTLHWDGSSWSLVLSPSTSPANKDVLWAVTALSANDVWAAGDSVDAISGNYSTLIEHWNGSAWSIVPSQNPSGSIYNFLWGIEALSANDIWVMGRSYTGNSYPGLIEHWDSSGWSIVPSPSERFYTELYGASPQSSRDVWAVGRQGDGFSSNLTLIEHWDGSAWSIVPHPEPAGSTDSYLYRIKGASSNDLWAVGAYLKNDTVYQTLIEHYSSVSCIEPSGVVSRKTHGGAGTFDVDLPLTGNPGIECRSGGSNGDYTLVFTFANTLASVASASVTSGTGSVASKSIDSTDAHNYIVNLTGVTNAQYITVSLANVTDSAGNFSSAVSATMGVLIGDVNASKLVDGNDVSAVQSKTRQSVNSTNFRYDVNVSGLIDGNDVSITQGQTRTAIR
jgi:hypothetical protein